MGNAVSGAVKAAQQQALDNEKQVIADLNNLSEILEAKANEYFVKLVNSKGEDKTIPIKTLIEYKKHVSASVSSGPSQKLNEAIESLFGGNFMSSLKAMALGAIDAVLGNTSAGSKEESGYKVLLLHNTIVRVDYYVYGFNMHTQTGTVDRSRNGLAFVATVGVVDMKQVGLEALVYLVGAQANEARAFISQKFDDYNVRLKNMNAIKKDLEGSTSTIKDMASLRGRAEFIDLEQLTDYLDEADSEVKAEKTNLKPGSASGAVVQTFDDDADKLDPATQTLEDARVTALKAWTDFKRSQIGKSQADKTAEAAKEFDTYKAAWLATAARAVPATNAMVRSHQNLMRGMTNEQMAIMEDIKTVYLRARSVTNVIAGVGA